MLEAEPIIEELDHIVNNAFPNHSEKVAHWKKTMGIDHEESDEGERWGQAFDTCDAKYLPVKIISANQRIPAKSYEEVIAKSRLN